MSENDESEIIMSRTPPLSIREALLQELQKLKTRLNQRNVRNPNRVPFFCQIDNETHSLIDSAYQCQICARYVCIDCYEELKQVNLPRCPFCLGKIHRIQ